MKKKLILLMLCCMAFSATACGSDSKKETESVLEPIPVEETVQTAEQAAPAATAPETTAPAEEAAGPTAAQQSASTAPVAEQAGAATDGSAITEQQALDAVKKYCIANNPDLADKVDSDEYTVYWEVSTNEANEIVVLYRSYTGSETRYYIDPVTGEAYATDRVPGIIDEEQRNDESLNVRDYMN